jgi:hypothetical protein
MRKINKSVEVCCEPSDFLASKKAEHRRKVENPEHLMNGLVTKEELSLDHNRHPEHIDEINQEMIWKK